MFNLKTKYIFIINSLIILNAIINVSAMHNPKSLKDLAGRILAKSTSSIKSLEIPEECHALLGLIAWGIPKDNTEINRETGGRLIDEKEYLDIAAIEPYLNKSFEELIQEKNKEGLPFILGIVASKENGTITYSYYDAHNLNKKLFGNNYAILAEDKRPSPFSKFFSYFTNNQIDTIFTKQIESIIYFIINDPNSTKASYIGSSSDLQKEQEEYKDQYYILHSYAPNTNDFIVKEYKNRLLNNIFLANQGNFIAQIQVGRTCYEHNKADEAKRYLLLASNQGEVLASYNLGEIYYKEGNIEKAKYYFNLAAQQDDAQARRKLGKIFKKEGNIEQAKHHYSIAASLGDAGAQSKLERLQK